MVSDLNISVIAPCGSPTLTLALAARFPGVTTSLGLSHTLLERRNDVSDVLGVANTRRAWSHQRCSVCGSRFHSRDLVTEVGEREENDRLVCRWCAFPPNGRTPSNLDTTRRFRSFAAPPRVAALPDTVHSGGSGGPEGRYDFHATPVRLAASGREKFPVTVRRRLTEVA